MQTRFQELLSAGKFEEANVLLRDELLSDKLIDPRWDPHWPTFADELATKLKEASGESAVTDFWEGLANFLKNEIEPKWQHVHKGYVYFRLGLNLLHSDIERGKRYLEDAYTEDKKLEEDRGSPKADSQSAYRMLAILEQIEDSEFASADDRRAFTNSLFGAFDTAINRRVVKEELIESALGLIVPAESLPGCISIYREVQVANNNLMPFTLVGITGTFVESMILAHLYKRNGIMEIRQGKSILKEELGPLFRAVSGELPPLPRLAFRLVYLFRNRVHPGNEIRQRYKLVPGVAATIKVFCDVAILDWKKSFEGR